MTLADQIAQIRTLASQGKNEVEIATATGLEIGDVASVLGGGGEQPGISAGVGAVAGVPRILKFPFAFDTPDLLTGHTVYTPTIGDLLIDAWLEVVESWSAADFNVVGGPLAAYGDVGAFANDGSGQGWWAWLSPGPILMQSVSVTTGFPEPNFASEPESAGSAGELSTLRQITEFWDLAAPGEIPRRTLPARFVRPDPIKVVVSSDGTSAGVDPRSTQGQAALYLVVATPATP